MALIPPKIEVTPRMPSVSVVIASKVGSPFIEQLGGCANDPALLLVRMTRTVFRKRCRVPHFIRALPLTVAALAVLVAGEWIGCLLGPGDALSEVE